MMVMTEANYKQEAVQHLFSAIQRADTGVTAMYYDSGKDGVLVQYQNSSLWVNTAGDSIIAMRLRQ
ncbi:MAG: hypothetical protein LBG43_08715 [Treponema sp.]|jgi:hypothetical protein|nr:hypothetical protein [Treponema sp.]